MAGLFHTLNIGSQSLYATRQGVDTAGHNIANAQVEGYSRQRVNLTTRQPLEDKGLLLGNGAYVQSISRAHDNFIENQLNKAEQDAGRSDARAEAMHNLEAVFGTELNANLSDSVTKFFGSLQNLANFPADYTVRTAVAEAGRDVAATFNSVDTDLRANREGVNEKIFDIVHKVNDNLQEIAALNIKIQIQEAGEGETANDFRDARDKLMRETSRMVELKYYQDDQGMMFIRGPNQVTLVDRGHAASLSLHRDQDNDGLYGVTITDWEGHSPRDVTRKMDGGALEALLEVRDKDITHLIERNNTMASTFADHINQVHREGFGIGEYAEERGRNFFAVPSNPDKIAAELRLDDSILESNDAIAAASTPEAPGDNVNVNAMIRLKDARIFAEENVTINDFYANFTGNLGLDVVRSDHIRQANDIMVKELNKRRESVAGVSLDEEAANMMKWQANFTASSKVITTIDEMLDTVLQLKR